jgi:hypothetical protein
MGVRRHDARLTDRYAACHADKAQALLTLDYGLVNGIRLKDGACDRVYATASIPILKDLVPPTFRTNGARTMRRGTCRGEVGGGLHPPRRRFEIPAQIVAIGDGLAKCGADLAPVGARRPSPLF